MQHHTYLTNQLRYERNYTRNIGKGCSKTAEYGVIKPNLKNEISLKLR